LFVSHASVNDNLLLALLLLTCFPQELIWNFEYQIVARSLLLHTHDNTNIEKIRETSISYEGFEPMNPVLQLP
jgi:hypothetical protein